MTSSLTLSESLFVLICCCLNLWVDLVQASTGTVGPSSGDLRLVNGGLAYGRVEVFYNGEWGTICDDRWDDYDAGVVCKTLGLRGGVAKPGGAYGQGTGKVWLTGLGCGEYDADLLYCIHRSIKENESAPCGHERDAGVECNKDPKVRFLKNKMAAGIAVIITSILILGLMCKCYKICTDRGRHKATDDVTYMRAQPELRLAAFHQDDMFYDRSSRRFYGENHQPNGEAVVLSNMNLSTDIPNDIATTDDDPGPIPLIIPPNPDPIPLVPPPTYEDVFEGNDDDDDADGAGFYVNKTAHHCDH